MRQWVAASSNSATLYPVTNNQDPTVRNFTLLSSEPPSIMLTEGACLPSEQAQHDTGHVYSIHFSNQLLIIMLFVAGCSLCYLTFCLYYYWWIYK